MSSRTNVVKLFVSFLIAGLMLAGNAWGASDSSGNEKHKPGEDNQSTASSDLNKEPHETDLQELISEFKVLRGKLRDIRQTALENNPELKEQKKELDTFIKETFDENLAAKGVEMSRVREVVNQLKTDKDMSKEKKERLKKEYVEAEKAYRKAKAETMQNEKVRDMRQDFGEKIAVAMKEEDPGVEDMVRRIQVLQREINQARRQSQPMPAPKKQAE